MSTILDEEVETVSDTSQKICPNWHVIFLNDDYHSFDFVIYVITTLFKKTFEEAFILTITIHKTGQGVITTCSKERALLYEEQVAGIKEGEKGAIGCVIEPAE